MNLPAAFAALSTLSLSSCLVPTSNAPPVSPPRDPAESVVVLPASSGWRAQLVLDVAPAGVWCVKPYDVFPQYAGPELVALDDLGRCWVLVSYGGRWTPFQTGPDGSWLGAVTQADLDPRIEGPELYAGAESGRVWQIVAHEREGVIDSRLVCQLDGRQIHAIVAGEFDDPENPSKELLVFTEPAELWMLSPRADGFDGFEAKLVAAMDGRVRDAVVVEGEAMLASRAGWIGRLRSLTPELVIDRIHELPSGRGRIAWATESSMNRGVAYAYSTAEDGTIWRHYADSGGSKLSNELIYAGPQGPRGIATGRFHADPERETVAVYGYSGRVELLTRAASGEGPWDVQVVFTDGDRGHWLASAELDGRNTTDELVLCGYSGRVVLLARQPGYGREGAVPTR